MAAVASAALCSASAGFALPHGSSAQSLGSQNAIARTPLLAGVRSNMSRRRAATCIKAVKNDAGKDQTGRQRAGLAGLLPSVAAMLIGGTSFAPDARAEMSSADYYKSLMESVKKSQTQAPAPVVEPILAQAPPIAATPVAAATPAADDDILSLFSSALETPSKKAEASKAAESEQPKAPTAADLRAKRVEEVAKREKEQAEKRAAEQKALEAKAQEAKDQAEARAKEAAAKAEKEAEQQAKRAQETAKGVAEAAKSKKTHGYLPLFLAQFLVLALYAGAITVAFFLPKSQSEKIERVLNELAEKVGPVVDKLKPLADQAVAAVNKLAKRAQPLVGKAAKEAVPLVRKAVDASKPLVSQAQAKAGEALEKVNEKVKASQES